MSGVVVAATVASYLFSREEVSRFSGPAGKYTVVISKRRYQSHVMRMPGQGSDAPGVVEIFDATGVSYGRVPVEMLQLADVRWTSSGAEIPLIGEWDFQRHTCWYWSRGQDRQVWVRR